MKQVVHIQGISWHKMEHKLGHMEHIVGHMMVHRMGHIIMGQLLKQPMEQVERKLVERSLVEHSLVEHSLVKHMQVEQIVRRVGHMLELVIQQVGELLIFQLGNIQLFLKLCQLEHILYSVLSELRECIQFNTQLRNNLSLFFRLGHTRQFLILHIQQRLFNMEHTRFLIHLRWGVNNSKLEHFELELKLKLEQGHIKLELGHIKLLGQVHMKLLGHIKLLGQVHKKLLGHIKLGLILRSIKEEQGHKKLVHNLVHRKQGHSFKDIQLHKDNLRVKI